MEAKALEASSIVHLILGDSAGGRLRQAMRKVRIVSTTDPLTEGPCRFEDGADGLRPWLEQRGQWWAGPLTRGRKAFTRAAVKNTDAFMHTLPDVAQHGAVVWVGDRVSEQLHLCWLAAVLPRELDAPVDLAVARLGPGGQRYVSVHSCPTESVRTAPVVKLEPEAIQRAAGIWSAYVGPVPERFAERILDARGDALVGNLAVLLRRFPSIEDGLSYWERRVLRELADHEDATLASTISNVIADQFEETPDSIGDQTLFHHRLRELGEQGLASRTGDGKSIRSTGFQITELGREVLSGARNRVDEVGFDRWIGGTHLRPGNMWWFDGETVRRRS